MLEGIIILAIIAVYLLTKIENAQVKQIHILEDQQEKEKQIVQEQLWAQEELELRAQEKLEWFEFDVSWNDFRDVITVHFPSMSGWQEYGSFPFQEKRFGIKRDINGSWWSDDGNDGLWISMPSDNEFVIRLEVAYQRYVNH